MEYDVSIIYRDSSLVIVNKPGGLLSVPGRGSDKQDCVVTRIKKQIPKMIDQPAVHRLDMFTSGLMILAINKNIHREMCRLFEQRLVDKHYVALLDGIIDSESGRIELPFRLDPDNRPFQVYDSKQGKPGITLWRRISIEENRTRVEFTPLTGRTHQLRLHSAHKLGLGTPIVGDRLYGSGNEGDQMLLHASFLRFTHPITGEELQLESPVPF